METETLLEWGMGPILISESVRQALRRFERSRSSASCTGRSQGRLRRCTLLLRGDTDHKMLLGVGWLLFFL